MYFYSNSIKWFYQICTSVDDDEEFANVDDLLHEVNEKVRRSLSNIKDNLKCLRWAKSEQGLVTNSSLILLALMKTPRPLSK